MLKSYHNEQFKEQGKVLLLVSKSVLSSRALSVKQTIITYSYFVLAVVNIPYSICEDTDYCTIQNFGGRKFWRNSSHQKLADIILVDAQNFQNA